jgi:predicted  nucleic acid-binding Zn-ribbon protein
VCFQGKKEQFMKRCQTCNDVFQEMGDWQKLCKPCWAKSKRAEESRVQEIEDERFRLLRTIGTLNRRIADLEDELTELKNDNVFDADFIKKLRVLSHPDKHNGSELSHNVCKVLNGLSQRATM